MGSVLCKLYAHMLVNKKKVNSLHHQDVVCYQSKENSRCKRDDNAHANRINFDNQNEEPRVVWLQLVDDAMLLIIQRLDVIDRLKMSLVCKSWKSLAMKKDIPVPTQFPWLMLSPKVSNNGYQLPFQSNNCKPISFFDMSQGKIYNYNLSMSVPGGWCFGCTKGWLWVGKIERNKPEVLLLNPISREKIPLPSLTTISSFNEFAKHLTDPYDFTSFINELAFSPSKDMTSCIVSVICDYAVVAVCKPGENKWIVVCETKEESDYFSSMAFHKGTLHVLGHTDVSNMDSLISERTIVPIKLVPDIDIAFNTEEIEQEGYTIIRNDGLMATYLVECGNELFIVARECDALSRVVSVEEDGEREIQKIFVHYKTTKFEVYKMDHGRGKLGDQVLFVGGKGTSLTISVKGLTGGVKGNCIYFLDETEGFDRDSGIHCLNDGQITGCYPSDKSLHKGWFVPHMAYFS